MIRLHYMLPMLSILSCARFLCNRARERAALEALDVGVLVEIALHGHRRALFIYEFEQLAFIVRVTLSAGPLTLSAGPLTVPAFSVFLSLCVPLSLALSLRLPWPRV